MKLHWSPKSPYVRKVMVMAHELGVADRIELIRSVALSTTVNPDIQVDNPLGKIPTLITDDGAPIFDSLVICQYLAEQAGREIMPSSGEAHWECLTRHALAQGMTDAAIMWRNEANRVPEKRLEPLITALEFKVKAALDELEARIPQAAGRPFDIGDAATGATLGWFEFRFADMGWRETRPALTEWYRQFEERPSAKASPIIDA